jgi:hypothetical protein
MRNSVFACLCLSMVLRALTGLHRVPATPQFDQAADFMLQQAKAYGLEACEQAKIITLR